VAALLGGPRSSGAPVHWTAWTPGSYATESQHNLLTQFQKTKGVRFYEDYGAENFLGFQRIGFELVIVRLCAQMPPAFKWYNYNGIILYIICLPSCLPAAGKSAYGCSSGSWNSPGIWLAGRRTTSSVVAFHRLTTTLSALSILDWNFLESIGPAL